jgi:hypothetical protein
VQAFSLLKYLIVQPTLSRHLSPNCAVIALGTRFQVDAAQAERVARVCILDTEQTN